MTLCSACEGISVDALNTFDQWKERLPYQHISNAQDLPFSARLCPLCALIKASLYQDYQMTNWKPIVKHEDEALESQNFGTGPILLTGKESSISVFAESEPVKALTGLHVQAPAAIGGFYYGILRLYAKRGTESVPFSHNISVTEPMLSHCSEDAFALLNNWLNECIRKHECCKQTFSQDLVAPDVEPDLPTRVLEVSQPQGQNVLRLVQTMGARGQYAALSHCWGPPSKRPLTTTTGTLECRLKEIPFKSLTKTFQDAVTITRAVGLRYLWIDSLCIIQDDNSDWLNEASHMGSIYERSQLTIAAAGAPDGSFGCFMERPQLSPAVELTNISEHGERAGGIFVSVKSMKGDTHPDYSPLNERAWITQEWLLSRRIVYYTKGQMVWSCKKKSQGEDHERLRLVARITADKLHWLDLVGNYCARKLTFNKDKLIALQGIASAWEKRTGDKWIHGVWTEHLLKYLFWRAPEDSTFAQLLIRPGVLPIPSWSWASTQGQLSFDNIDTTDQFCSKIAIEDSRLLSVCSRVKALTAGFDGPLDPEKPGTGHHILDQQGQRFGKAYFDEGKVPSGSILAVPLVKIGHGSPPDPLNPGWFKVLLIRQALREDPGLHVRVGLGEIDQLDWFEGVPERLLSIS